MRKLRQCKDQVHLPEATQLSIWTQDPILPSRLPFSSPHLLWFFAQTQGLEVSCPHWPPSPFPKFFFFSSVQFSHSVVSDSLRPHELQHARPPCPSPTPGVHSNSCPSSRWCRPAISSSVVPFSSCPQSLLASESFPMSQLFAWGGPSTGVFFFLGPLLI